MKLEITKMHGIGNSYVIIEDFNRKLQSKYSKIARVVSDKSFGVGSDGILVLNKGKTAKYCMRIFNPDGSEAEMCGNGIRAFARYLYDRKLIGKEAEIEVGGRIIKPRINGNSVTVDMGEGKIIGKKTLTVNGTKFSGVQVSVGNPHLVIFANNEKEAEENVKKYGHAIENHDAFPNRTNVEFAFVKSRNEIILRVWERGAGLTLACGSGACATAFAAFQENRTGNKVNIRLPGGVLAIEIKGSGSIIMSGPAEYIFSGFIDLEKLIR